MTSALTLIVLVWTHSCQSPGRSLTVAVVSLPLTQFTDVSPLSVSVVQRSSHPAAAGVGRHQRPHAPVWWRHQHHRGTLHLTRQPLTPGVHLLCLPPLRACCSVLNRSRQRHDGADEDPCRKWSAGAWWMLEYDPGSVVASVDHHSDDEGRTEEH